MQNTEHENVTSTQTTKQRVCYFIIVAIISLLLIFLIAPLGAFFMAQIMAFILCMLIDQMDVEGFFAFVVILTPLIYLFMVAFISRLIHKRLSLQRWFIILIVTFLLLGICCYFFGWFFLGWF